MAELDPDRALALAYVPAPKRVAVETLWRLDAALGQVLAGGREPLISQIKLAWWREALERLDREKAPAEPILEAVAAYILPAGVTGSDLSTLEQGWSVLLSAEPLTAQDLKTYSTFRGAILFRLTAKLLGVELPPELEPAGEGWALVELARHSNPADAAAAFEAAVEPLSLVAGSRWPAAVRPLGMLSALARRDLNRGFGNIEQEGAPGRMLRMLRHRLTGR